MVILIRETYVCFLFDFVISKLSYLWIHCKSSTWKLFIMFSAAYNLGCLFVLFADAIVTGHYFTWLSVEFTYVFSADALRLSHILFKYFANIYVDTRTACKDIYYYLVFIVYLWWVIHQWNLGPFARDQFFIWYLFVQRFKYSMESFSISTFVRYLHV